MFHLESGFITYETFDALLTTSWNLGVQHRYIVCVAILNVSNTMELVNHCNTKFKWYYIHVLCDKFIVNHIYSTHLVSKHDHREPVFLFHRQQMKIRPLYIILLVTFLFTLYCFCCWNCLQGEQSWECIQECCFSSGCCSWILAVAVASLGSRWCRE